MKQCPKCGRQFPDEFRFCQDDAAPLTAAAEGAAAQYPPKRPGKAALAVGTVAALSLIVGALLHHAPAAPPATSIPSSPASLSGAAVLSGDAGASASAAWQTYRSPQLGFGCDYPAGWNLNVTPSRASPGATRVLFQSPDPDVTILVDAEPGTTGQTPLQKWQDFDGRFRRVYRTRYEALGVQETRLAGYDAASWRSTLQHAGGPRLEREDVRATIAGRDYALMLSAPPDRFGRWQGAFDHVTQSFVAVGQ